MSLNINPAIKFFLVVKPSSDYHVCYAAYRVEDAEELASEHFEGNKYPLKEMLFEALPYDTVIRRTNLRMEDTYNLPYISQKQCRMATVR